MPNSGEPLSEMLLCLAALNGLLTFAVHNVMLSTGENTVAVGEDETRTLTLSSVIAALRQAEQMLKKMKHAAMSTQ
jgi:hypothetical protein